MGFLRSTHNNPAAVPHYTGLQIQTSSNAVPIAIVWGTAKIAPNVIWTGGFYSVKKTDKSGGKGGGGGAQVTGYEYFSHFAMGLCEGPIGGFGKIWVGQSIYGGLYGSGLTFSRYGGTPQAPWPFLTPTYGQQALGYNGLAYIAANNYDLGSSPVLPQISAEVFGAFTGSGFVNTYDADPSLVVQDFLTNMASAFQRRASMQQRFLVRRAHPIKPTAWLLSFRLAPLLSTRNRQTPSSTAG
jgi:hypothetical protein